MPALITNKNLGFTKQKCNCGIISNSIGGFQKTINKSNKNKSNKNKSNKNKSNKIKVIKK
jgi:hypothetical protein